MKERCSLLEEYSRCYAEQCGILDDKRDEARVGITALDFRMGAHRTIAYIMESLLSQGDRETFGKVGEIVDSFVLDRD